MIDKIILEDFGPDEAKMTMEIPFSQLNLFAGKNGSGKTLIFKISWFLGFTLELYKTMLLMQIPNIDEQFKKEAELVFDMTFTSKERISGAAQISDTNNEIYEYSCVIGEGQIATFDINVMNIEAFKIGEIKSIRYNSKDARTFSQYSKYLKLKKKLGIELTSMEEISEFKDFFQIYDMLWFESMRSLLDRHTAGEETSISMVLQLWDTHLAGNEDATQKLPYAKDFVFKDSMIYVDNDDVKMKPVSDYDLGTQSMIMLTMFAGA